MNATKKRALKSLLVLLILLTLCFIWGNSLMNAERSSQFSNGLFDVLRPLMNDLGLHPEDDLGLRDLAHLAEFGALGAELALLFLLERGLCAAVFRKSAILSLLTAVVDELLQLIGDRAAQLIDVGLDFLGACLGMAIIWLIAVCVKKKRNR